MNNKHFLLVALSSLILFACQPSGEQKQPGETKQVSAKKNIPVPDFNADSAYSYIEKQVAFGPRTPASKAHEQCANFLTGKLSSFGWEVQIQTGTAKTFDGKQFTLKNIIASYKPDLPKRILLCAHWDSRPFADRDTKDTGKPIDGANDGASGVGVLLEIARQIQTDDPEKGVDIIFFDLEDYGQPHDLKIPEQENTWCLGTQHWAKNPHKAGYYAEFGILLDMVGAKDAIFPMEGTSMFYAAPIVRKVWKAAGELGYGNYFVTEQTGQTIDDHYYINAISAIPVIDIVHYEPRRGDYGSFHHTHSDNMSLIDKSTLKAVGQTVLQVLYTE